MIASQRLGEKLIKDHDIIGQFKKLNIRVVINLQEPGEHPYCGEPVVPEWGFSYSSEGLNNRRIGLYRWYIYIPSTVGRFEDCGKLPLVENC